MGDFHQKPSMHRQNITDIRMKELYFHLSAIFVQSWGAKVKHNKYQRQSPKPPAAPTL